MILSLSMKFLISWQLSNQITRHIIINPLNKNKNVTFLHSGRVWVWVRGGYIYPRYQSCTRILKSGKTQTQSNRKKSVKSGLVWAGTHGHGFCCHAYLTKHNQTYIYLLKINFYRRERHIIPVWIIIRQSSQN